MLRSTFYHLSSDSQSKTNTVEDIYSDEELETVIATYVNPQHLKNLYDKCQCRCDCANRHGQHLPQCQEAFKNYIITGLNLQQAIETPNPEIAGKYCFICQSERDSHQYDYCEGGCGRFMCYPCSHNPAILRYVRNIGCKNCGINSGATCQDITCRVCQSCKAYKPVSTLLANNVAEKEKLRKSLQVRKWQLPDISVNL